VPAKNKKQKNNNNNNNKTKTKTKGGAPLLGLVKSIYQYTCSRTISRRISHNFLHSIFFDVAMGDALRKSTLMQEENFFYGSCN